MSTEMNKEKNLEQKFVHWEPYHAAVAPIKIDSGTPSKEILNKIVKIPYKHKSDSKVNHKLPTSNTESSLRDNKTEEQIDDGKSIACLDRHEVGDGRPSDEETNRIMPKEHQSSKVFCSDDKHQKLIHDYESVAVDRDSLMEQLQVQLKVNAELKKLLVATMGDDLPEKMECLTNDKARLAQDIVHYSAKLSNDQERIERVNIQCDVWRSKFLASSIMVDELVSWRFFLIRQFEESQRIMKNLMDEHDELRKHLYQSFLLLQETKEALDPLMHGKYRHLVQYHTIYDLITTVHSLSDALHHRLLNNRRTPEFYGEKREPMVGFTEAEVAANKILNVDAKNFYAASPCEEFQRLTDKQAKLMGYPTHCNFRNITANCCRKCKGEIKLV